MGSKPSHSSKASDFCPSELQRAVESFDSEGVDFLSCITDLITMFRGREIERQRATLDFLKKKLCTQGRGAVANSRFAAAVISGRLLAEVPSSLFELEDSGLGAALRAVASKSAKTAIFDPRRVFCAADRAGFAAVETVDLVRRMDVGPRCEWAKLARARARAFPPRSNYLGLVPLAEIATEAHVAFARLRLARARLLEKIAGLETLTSLRLLRPTLLSWTRLEREALETTRLGLLDADCIALMSLQRLREQLEEEKKFQNKLEELLDQTLQGNRSILSLSTELKVFSSLLDPPNEPLYSPTFSIEDTEVPLKPLSKAPKNITSMHELRLEKSAEEASVRPLKSYHAPTQSTADFEPPHSSPSLHLRKTSIEIHVFSPERQRNSVFPF